MNVLSCYVFESQRIVIIPCCSSFCFLILVVWHVFLKKKRKQMILNSPPSLSHTLPAGWPKLLWFVTESKHLSKPPRDWFPHIKDANNDTAYIEVSWRLTHKHTQEQCLLWCGLQLVFALNSHSSGHLNNFCLHTLSAAAASHLTDLSQCSLL